MSIYGGLRDNIFVWKETEEQTPELTQYWGTLWKSSLNHIERTLISDSRTAKFNQDIYGDKIFWIAQKRPEDDYTGHLYSLDGAGKEIQIDQSASGVSLFTVSEKYIVWVNGLKELIRFAISDGTETVLASFNYPVGTMAQWEKDFYISDLNNSPDPGSFCGVSIYKYDLDTSEVTPFKLNEGYIDYFVDDVWEDWLLFTTCNEGGVGDDSQDTCCLKQGLGDVYLRYLPTGEEWNLSNSFGDQVLARMWGPLVVWRDGRNRESGHGNALYGIDLCKHPELKSRFSECQARKKR